MSILGLGTDIVECLRIAQMIERHGELFITRVYTDHEIEYCSARKAATQHYAGRWAAKEAVLKALGTGWQRGISWRDIEIRNDRLGAPSVVLRAGARVVGIIVAAIGERFLPVIRQSKRDFVDISCFCRANSLTRPK